MPDATELAARADIKTMLGLTDTTQDALLDIIKSGVEAWVKNFTGRDLLVTSYTEYHDGDGSNVVRLDQRPITAITSIYADPSRLFEAATLIPSTDIISDTKGQRLGFVELLTYKFTKGLKSTRVIYSAGYSTVPTDLSMAVKQIVCKQFKVISKKMFAEVSQQAGDMTVTLSVDAWPKDAMEVIRSYRRMDF